jgi:protein-disulfide isomerase
MHQALYRAQRQWAESSAALGMFADMAQGLGLDRDKFLTDLNSQAAGAKVNADVLSGTKAGLNGTPTFFLNGERIQPNGYDAFRSRIEAKLLSNP